MNMFRLDNINVPIVGVVENMSWFTPAELPNQKYKLFGEGGGKKLAKMSNSVLLGQIPLISEVGTAGDQGKPIMTNKDHLARDYFMEMSKATLRQINIRNEVLGRTQIVSVK